MWKGLCAGRTRCYEKYPKSNGNKQPCPLLARKVGRTACEKDLVLRKVPEQRWEQCSLLARKEGRTACGKDSVLRKVPA